MLIVNGKHQEASILCQSLGLQKWALFFDQDQNLCKQLITEERVKNFEPVFQVIEEVHHIKTIFPVNFDTENNLPFIWKRVNETFMAEGFIMTDSRISSELLSYLRWAYIIIKVLNTELSQDIGMIIFLFSSAFEK